MKRLRWCWILVMLQLSVGPLVAGFPESQSDAGRDCLRGRILPSPTGAESSAGVAVTLHGSAYLQQVNAVMYGPFEFCSMPAGDYILEARADGFDVTRIPLRNWSGHDRESLIVRMWPAPTQPAPFSGTKTVSIRSLSLPRKARAEMDRFLHFAAQQNWEKSIAALVKATEIYPDYLDAWINLGIVYTKLNRVVDAETAYKRAIEINPDEPVARRKLGLLYISRQQLENAVHELEMAARLNPQDARTQAYLGQTCSKTGNLERAEDYLARAIALEPDMPLALYELGFVQLRQDRRQEALATFERFLNRSPSSPESEEVRALVSRLHLVLEKATNSTK